MVLKRKAVALVSGGLDSMLAVHLLIDCQKSEGEIRMTLQLVKDTI